MLRRWKSALGMFPAALGGLMLANTCWGADVIVRTYDAPSGEKIGAVTLPFEAQSAYQQNVSHVILFDTSASQVGLYRKDAADVLSEVLKNLPDSDRAKVLAYDINTADLTAGFSAPAAAAVESSTNLATRFPAGSSNLKLALETAIEELADAKAASIIIIGDGLSISHLFSSEELGKLTSELRSKKIPVHSYAIGMNTDLRLLGSLGEQTGGFVASDDWSTQGLSSQEIGKRIADAARQIVFYPTHVSVNRDDLQVLPANPLPMRTDRETVYLINGPTTAGVKFMLSGEYLGKEQSLSYSLPEQQRSYGNTFLGAFWNQAKSTQGLSNGLAGDWMVNQAHQSFEDYVAALKTEGERSIQNGSFQHAEQIGTMLTALDPQNSDGENLSQRSRDSKNGIQLVMAQFDFEEPEVTAPDFGNRELQVPADSITQYESLRQAKGQKLQRQVEEQLFLVDRYLADSLANEAEDVITRTLRTVKASTDVEPQLLQNLQRQLVIKGNQVRSRRLEIDQIRREQENINSQIAERDILFTYEADRQANLVSMVDQIRSSMRSAAEGNIEAYDSAEEVARNILSNYPGSAIGMAEVFTTEAAQQLDRSTRLRALRSDMFLETLHQVELSHVPFPDNNVIVYPDAEFWAAITAKREKWKTVDLQFTSKNEEKIYRALDENTTLEFPPGLALKEALDDISMKHDFPIVSKKVALDAEGIDLSTTTVEEMQISGIKLRSALKLLLEEHDLTYVIEDEVMKITTKIDADTKPKFRIYPLGELANLQPMGGMGGMGGGMGGMGGGMGGMGGGMGGMGGGMGGMGGGMGGMGGMGGGMGGMGGMGGGMGMFSIPAVDAENAHGLAPQQLDKKKQSN